MAIVRISDDDKVIDFLYKSMGKEKALNVLKKIEGDIGIDKCMGFEKANKQAALIYKFGNIKDPGLVLLLADTKEEILEVFKRIDVANELANLADLSWGQFE